MTMRLGKEQAAGYVEDNEAELDAALAMVAVTPVVAAAAQAEPVEREPVSATR
jgi:hypothetical protein